jgi:hypothetical protein
MMRISPLLVSLTLLGVGMAQARKVAQQRQETPNETFHHQGGKTTKVEVISKNSELTTVDIAQGRNLSLYDDGRHFNCYFIYEGDEPECSIPAVRDFIWQHWQSQRRGYVRLTRGSIDAVSTSHIFIEPDRRGAWHVVWRVVRHSGEVNDMPDIISVRQRPATEDDDGYQATTILLFIGRDGDEIQSL